jgi:hypothetical protein
MAKTHHRRRHRRANRTRRGGVKSNTASAASAFPDDMEAIKARVREIAAQATTPKKTISKKPKITSAQKHFEKVLAGKATHSSKSSFRHDSGVSDSRIGQKFVHGQ